MATSSIFTNVVISDSKKAELFIDAMDNAYQSPEHTKINYSNSHYLMTDKSEIKKLFEKRIGNR